MIRGAEDVIRFCGEEDVKFIRLAFCDMNGVCKNISVMPTELRRAFGYGIPFDGSAVAGFDGGTRSDLFLRPDPDTLAILPWRPEKQRVARMYCGVSYPDGSPHGGDIRTRLKAAARRAALMGIEPVFAGEYEFTVTNADNHELPCDRAGYSDTPPEDRGAELRRQLCLTLGEMGVAVAGSFHGGGAGRSRIRFGSVSALQAVDDAVTFITALKAVAAENGLYAEPTYGRVTVILNGSGAENAAERLLSHGGGASLRLLARKDNALTYELPVSGVNPYLAPALLIGTAAGAS